MNGAARARGVVRRVRRRGGRRRQLPVWNFLGWPVWNRRFPRHPGPVLDEGTLRLLPPGAEKRRRKTRLPSYR